MPRISVVVPAFDVGEYVGALLRDLERQTYRDFEVLVVDDGSTDGTRQVIAQCTERDQRFRLLTTDGSGAGPSTARNLGLGQATGEELAFVDADDRLAPDYLEVLHRSLAETGSDVASCNVRRLNGFETGPSSPHFRVFDRDRPATHLRRANELVYDSTIWNKLSRRRLWAETEIRFDDGRWINDIYPSLRLHVAARQVDVLTRVLYYWRLRSDATASITSSKLVDADARLKSLEDRFHALERTRRMLAEELGDPAVVERFDERVMLHDLRVYLSLHAEDDDRYREALSRAVLGYLRAHAVDPERYELGAFLHETYRAILAADDDRLARVLDPATRLVALGRRGRVRARLETAGRRRWHETLRLPLSGSGAVDVTDRVEARVRITRVRLDPMGGPLRVAGEARVRDGRDNLDGDWRIGLTLDGRHGGGEVRGAPALLGPTGAHEHPMLRRGWRDFEAAVDLPVATDAEQRPSWRLSGRMLLDDTEIAVEPYLTDGARRTLGGGASMASSIDLVPVSSRDGHLVLRAEDANVRLTEARPTGSDEFVVRLVRSSATVERLSLRTATGEEGGSTGLADGDAGDIVEVVLPIPRSPADTARWELWAHRTNGDERVRAHPSLTATWLAGPEPDGTEGIVLRPTTRGRVVLDREPAHIEVDGLEQRTELGLSGPVLGPHQPAEDSRLEARCRWTDTRVTAHVCADAGRWEARLPSAALAEGVDDGGRAWSLHLVDTTGDDAIAVPTGGRHRFPLSTKAETRRYELRVDRGGAATLWVLPSP